MRRLLIVILSLAGLGLLGTSVQAVEVLRWERLPLAVPLVVGQERVIFLDHPVKVGYERALTGRLRVQTAGGAVYLRAEEAIEPTRLHLQRVDTGELILLDIAATPGDAPLEPVKILTGDEAGESAADEPAPPPVTPVPVALTRHAAQSLYAPLRTVEPLPGVSRVPLRVRGALPTLLPTEPVISEPLAAWRLAEFWVTAVRLTNRAARQVILDPHHLQGQFQAATFQHGTLGPAGTAEDTSVVYLVTQGGGLEGALLPPAPAGEERPDAQ